MLVAGARFITNWLVASHYGPVEHGRFALVFQFVSMLIVMGELGIVSTFGVRQIALAASGPRGRLNRLINDLSGTLLLVQFGLAIVLAVFAEPLARVLGANAPMLRLASVWLVAFVLYRTTMMLANGLESMAYSGLTTVIFYRAWMGWLGWCLAMGDDLLHLFEGWAMVLPLAGAACWLAMPPLLRRHELSWRPRLSGPRTTLGTVVSALPYALPLMGTLVLPGVMCLLLARWHDSAQVSYFQICFSLGILANVVALPAASALLPALTRMSAAESDVPMPMAPGGRAAPLSTGDLVRRGFFLMTILVSLAFALYWPLGRTVLGLVGPAYTVHVLVLLLIAAGVGFDACRVLLDQRLLASGHVRPVAWAEAGRFAVLLAVAAWAVPPFGVRGAAVAVFVSMVLNCLAKVAAARALVQLNLWWPFAALAVLLGAIAAAGHWLNGWLALLVWLGGAGLLWRWQGRGVSRSEEHSQ